MWQSTWYGMLETTSKVDVTDLSSTFHICVILSLVSFELLGMFIMFCVGSKALAPVEWNGPHFESKFSTRLEALCTYLILIRGIKKTNKSESTTNSQITRVTWRTQITEIKIWKFAKIVMFPLLTIPDSISVCICLWHCWTQFFILSLTPHGRTQGLRFS